jgi:hypothetical protein
MSQPQEKPNAAADRRKLVLVAVLAVILVVVLIVQFGGDSSAKQAGPQNDAGKDQASAPNKASATPKTHNAKKAPTAQRNSQRWSILDLADVLGYDPFANLPALADQQEPTDTPPDSQRQQKPAGPSEEMLRRRAEQEQALDRLRQEGVTIFVGSGNDRVAVVGSETIEVGDLLDGFRVIAIEPDGVVLEQLEIEPGIK